MKFSKDKLTEYMTLYLNDLSDYGDDEEYELAESILNPFMSIIDESEEDIHGLLKEIAKNSHKHKQIIMEFLEYVNEIPEKKHEIKNPDYYQQLLNSYDNRRLSISSKKYFQGIIDSIKRQNNLATPKQFDILQRLKTGDFNYGKK